MKKSPFRYVVKNMGTVLGVVLVWRGVWELLDKIDFVLFGGSHILTAVGGIVLGFLVLYLPDRDLREIERI
jgi:hypothetical protein